MHVSLSLGQHIKSLIVVLVNLFQHHQGQSVQDHFNYQFGYCAAPMADANGTAKRMATWYSNRTTAFSVMLPQPRSSHVLPVFCCWLRACSFGYNTCYKSLSVSQVSAKHVNNKLASLNISFLGRSWSPSR